MQFVLVGSTPCCESMNKMTIDEAIMQHAESFICHKISQTKEHSKNLANWRERFSIWADQFSLSSIHTPRYFTAFSLSNNDLFMCYLNLEQTCTCDCLLTKRYVVFKNFSVNLFLFNYW